jgi:hypothetical protein
VYYFDLLVITGLDSARRATTISPATWVPDRTNLEIHFGSRYMLEGFQDMKCLWDPANSMAIRWYRETQVLPRFGPLAG